MVLQRPSVFYQSRLSFWFFCRCWFVKGEGDPIWFQIRCCLPGKDGRCSVSGRTNRRGSSSHVFSCREAGAVGVSWWWRNGSSAHKLMQLQGEWPVGWQSNWLISLCWWTEWFGWWCSPNIGGRKIYSFALCRPSKIYLSPPSSLATFKIRHYLFSRLLSPDLISIGRGRQWLDIAAWRCTQISAMWTPLQSGSKTGCSGKAVRSYCKWRQSSSWNWIRSASWWLCWPLRAGWTGTLQSRPIFGNIRLAFWPFLSTLYLISVWWWGG